MSTVGGRILPLLRRLGNHCVCFVIPSIALAFLWSGPHSAFGALLWMLPIWATVLLDRYGPKVCSEPSDPKPAWLYFGTLYLLAGMQCLNVLLTVVMASQLQWQTQEQLLVLVMNMFAIKVIIGTSSSFSGIIVAHELLHRRSWYLRALGRWLLALVCYEHFSTEHVRGHHRRVGHWQDPATARYGESFRAYWRRSVPAQFRNAWSLEQTRLNHPRFWDSHLMQNQVLQGVLVQAGLIITLFAYFGFFALFAFLLQALAAVRKLEIANYIEHWGLSQDDNQMATRLTWETNSWFTRHAMLGLSLHTDHHAHATRPYHRLQYCAQSPQLSNGYFYMTFLVTMMNQRYQQLAREELRSRGLGPA